MRAVQSLQQRLGKVLRIDARLWKSLWIAVAALVLGGDLRPAILGRFSKRPTAQKHRIKAVDRLLSNPRLHAALGWLYKAFAELLIHNAASVVILVDWTQVDHCHKAIVGAVPIGGRAVPILCHVHANASQPTPAMHRRFLKELKRVLPKTCVPILVTDAGFQNSWVAEVRALKWFYVARLRHRTCVRKEGDTVWKSNKALHAEATTRPRDLGDWSVGKDSARQRLTTRLVLAKRVPRGRHRLGRRGQRLRGGGTERLTKQHREPWLLSTNLTCPANRVVNLYEMRMQIEQIFRDAKSSSFGWSLASVRSSDTSRLEVLLLIATAAFITVALVGLAAEENGTHRELQANTERRRVLSLTRVGSLVLTTETSFRPSDRAIAGAIRHLRGLLAV